MQIQRHWLVLAGFFGLTATMLGAYGAHGLAATGIAPSLLAAFNTSFSTPWPCWCWGCAACAAR